jgi:hypothetical protein
MDCPMQQPNTRETQKRKGRLAVYLWRKTHPDAYKALCRKSSHTYYTKHRDIISERRKKEREAARYVAAEQAEGRLSVVPSIPSL